MNSYKLRDLINEKVIISRKKILEKLAEKSTLNSKKEYIGKTFTVLIEQKINNLKNTYVGFSENYLKVQVESKNCIKNKLVKVKLENLDKNGNFNGKIVKL